MPIPDFQSIMRPLLAYLSDGRERGSQETFEALATEFSLSSEERSQLLPSGKQPVFVNRVAWAKSHLKGAGLVESPKRGVYRITERGRALLADYPGPIGMKTLQRFPEYVEFRTPSAGPGPVVDPVLPPGEISLTPEELIDYGYGRIRAQLAQEIISKVKSSPPEFFEQLVVELLVAMGYGGSLSDAGRAVGRGGDGGIDGIIKEDKLGLDTIYIQAKRWEGSVGRPEIQKFAGALQGVRARKGIFITTSSFTSDAQSYAGNIDTRIVLIDGPALANLMMDHDVGVTRVQSYDIKRLDSDYFSVDE
jgi:restriction system protein